MTDLAMQRCEACAPGTPTLTAEEIAELRPQLAGDWRVEDSHLRRSLKFRDFSSAFGTATRIAMLAEAEGHHPEMTVGWGHVDVELTTHSAGGLTRNDFILAAKIDALG